MKPQGSGLNIKNISIHHPVDDLHRDLGLKWLKPFPWFSQEWFYSPLPWIFNISHLIFIQFSRDCSSLPKWYGLGPTANALGRTTKNRWGGKKTPRTFAWPFFCYRFFFFLIVLQGIVITVTNIIDLVLQTIFCMTSLPNSITSNIISRGRRQQSRRRQRCSRRQRQKQVPRAGLGEEDFFC